MTTEDDDDDDNNDADSCRGGVMSKRTQICHREVEFSPFAGCKGHLGSMCKIEGN